MLKKIFSHTAIYGMAPYIPKIASFFILPFITKHLTSFDYAVSGLVSAYIGIISAVSTLGLRLILVNSFYKHPNHYKLVWRQISGFLTLWNIPYALLCAILIYCAIPQKAMINAPTIIALNVIGTLAFGKTSLLGSTYYQLKKQPMQIAIRSVIFGVIGIFLNLYTIAFLHLGYMGWFWSSFIISLLSNASYWYPINFKLNIRPIYKFKKRLLKNSLKVSLPTVPHYYSSYLLDSSDRMVMSFTHVAANDIGKYNVAYTMGNYAQSIGMATGMAINPFLNEKYKKKDFCGARNLIFLLQALFLGGTFLICIWMKEIFFVLIKNKELSQMYSLAIIIVMSYNYRPFYLGGAGLIFYNEKTNKLWRITFVAGVINVLLNLILIPLLSYKIAAVTTFAALLYMGFGIYFSKSFKFVNQGVNYYPVRWMIATILTAFFAYFLVEIPALVKIVITVVMSAAMLMAYKKYSKYFVE